VILTDRKRGREAMGRDEHIYNSWSWQANPWGWVGEAAGTGLSCRLENRLLSRTGRLRSTTQRPTFLLSELWRDDESLLYSEASRFV
jgi:hypothetical protein